MNDSQKIGMLAAQLKLALAALDNIADWPLDTTLVPPVRLWAALHARETLRRIRGGDGRPPPKVSR